MRTWPMRLTLLGAALLLAFSVLVTGTFAWKNEQQALNDVLEDGGDTRVTLLKREKTTEGEKTDKALPGAVFRLFRANGTQIGGEYETDDYGRVVVRLAPGNYYFKELSPAEGYTYDRDSAGTAIKQYPFTVKTGDEAVTVYAYNRPDNGEEVEISGEKTWVLQGARVDLPASITVRLMNGGEVVDQQTVRPDGDGHWRYTFRAPKYRPDGKEIVYTVEEEPVSGFGAAYDGYDIVNTWLPAVTAELPDIIKLVEGEDAPRERFCFTLTGEDGAPMPQEAEGETWTVSRAGAGRLSLGSVTFTAPGRYVYTLAEEPGEDYNWHYDSARYQIVFRVVVSGDRLSCTSVIRKDGSAADEVVFTNRYEEIDLDETITIAGQKTWDHGDDPQKNWPSHIVIRIFADGQLTLQHKVTAASGWKYSFDLRKYTEDGREIRYMVDEAPVTDYSKRIDGYDIFNTYTGTPEETPEEPDEPAKPIIKPPKTGEDFDLTFWVVAAALSLGGLLLMLALLRKRTRYQGKRARKRGGRNCP